MGSAGPKPGRPVAVPKDRLDSWKEIAAYLNRDVRTVQRWEHEFGLPVQRLPAGPKAGVFALRCELDDWLETRRAVVDTPEAGRDAPPPSPQPEPLNRRRRWWLWASGAVFLAILCAGTAYTFAVVRNPRILMAQESQFTPFANAAPVQVCPAWSPDGAKIAFLGAPREFGQVFVQGLDQSAPVAITTRDVVLTGGADPVWCRAPVWSPDSQWLYFFGGQSGRTGLWRVSAGGGPVALVQEAVLAASISPDGKSLVFLAGSDNDKRVRVWIASPPDGERRLYLPVPFALENLVGLPQLRFAPDGRKLAVAIDAKPDVTYRILPWPPATSRAVFTQAERGLGVPELAWMPDSRHAAIAAAGTLGMADFETDRYWPIAIQAQPVNRLSVSPDGSRIAFQSSLSHADVVAVPLNGGQIQTLAGSTRTEQMPSASPVGPVIAYITNKRRPAELWLKDLPQGADRPLLSPRDVLVGGVPANLLLTPVFSPDGRRIAFTAVSSKGAAIFTIPATGGPPVRARGGLEIDEVTPTWSPDGEWLAFRTRDNKLAKMRVGSTAPVEELALTCRSNSAPEWSPSGDWIAYAAGACETALVSPDGKSHRMLGGVGVVAWSRDGKTLYRVDPKQRVLMALEIAGGQWRTVRDVGDQLPYSGPQPGLRASVSHDGASLIYSAIRPREEIWILHDVSVRQPLLARLMPFLGRWRP